jgi:hypothetical protein
MEYKFYLLNSTGAIQAQHNAEFRDDDTAYAAAIKLFRGYRFQVWQRERQVDPGRALITGYARSA